MGAPQTPDRAGPPPLMERFAEPVALAKAELQAHGLKGSVLLTHEGFGCVGIHVTGVAKGRRAVPRALVVEAEDIAVEVALRRLVKAIIQASGEPGQSG